MAWSDTALQLYRLNDFASTIVYQSANKDSVRHVAVVGPDRFVSWGADGLRLWDFEGRLVLIPEHTEERWRGVLPLTEGRFLSWNGNVLRLWTSDGVLCRSFEGHTSSVLGAQSLTRRHFISWAHVFIDRDYLVKDGDTRLLLWDVDGGRTEFHLPGRFIKAVSISDETFVMWVHDIGGAWDGSSSIRDRQIWLCDVRGKVLSTVHSLRGRDSRRTQTEWAVANDLDPEWLQSTPAVSHGAYDLRIGERRLSLHRRSSRERVATFHCDANPTFAVMTGDGVIFGGDETGRILRLRYT